MAERSGNRLVECTWIIITACTVTFAQTRLDPRQIAPSYGPTQINAEMSATRLVARIETRLLSTASSTTPTRLCGGILFGYDAVRMYIATANHCVRHSQGIYGACTISFNWSPQPRPCTIASHFDAKLDVAVVSMANSDKLSDQHSNLSFNRIRSAITVKRGEEAFTIGHPYGRNWYINVRPDVVSAADGTRILFESDTIAPGNSGGALLDASRMLIGMVRSDDPPIADAVSMTTVINLVRGWDYPVLLGDYTITAPEIPVKPLTPPSTMSSQPIAVDQKLIRAKAMHDRGELKIQGGAIDVRTKRPSDRHVAFVFDTRLSMFGPKREELEAAIKATGAKVVGCCSYSVAGLSTGSGEIYGLGNTVGYLNEESRQFAHRVATALAPWIRLTPKKLQVESLPESARIVSIFGGIDVIVVITSL